jgi:uncharacterized protein YdhG (YjbR/CyaY superfamily)
MTAVKKGYTSIPQYIRSFPKATRERLEELRAAIKSAAPEAAEKISYQMPTLYLHGNLVHFAAYEHHIGFYPAPSGIAAFQDQLKGYKTSKGAVQFPMDKPLPLTLIKKIVRYRVGENVQKASAPKKQPNILQPSLPAASATKPVARHRKP